MANNLTTSGLKLAYLITTKRVALKRLLIGSLIFLIVILFGFTGWRLIRLFFIDYDAYQRLLLELPLDLVNYQGIKELTRPADLVNLGVSLILVKENQYDVLARVSNPNARWLVEFDYRFVAEGLESERQKGFLLPGEQKYLMDLAVASTRRISAPILEIQNLRWKKVLNFEEAKADRFNFTVSEPAFIPPSAAQIAQRLPISKTTFNVSNNSVYNYWQVGLQVVLFTGNRVVAANRLVIERFMSGERRPVEISWFQPLGTITKTEVIPEVNILDPQAFFGFAGDLREEFRDVPERRF